MSRENTKIEYKVITTIDECITRLEGLLDGMRTGHIVLKSRADAVDLSPARIVHLEVKARQKGSKESVAIKIDWKNVDALLTGKDSDLVVDSGEGSAQLEV